MDMSKLLADLKKAKPSTLKEYFDECENDGWEGWAAEERLVIHDLIYDIRVYDGTKPFDIEAVSADVIKMYLVETVSNEFADWYPNQAEVIKKVIDDIVMYVKHAE
jgi:hypothetical protein